MSPKITPKKNNKGVQEINLDELGLEVLSKNELGKIDFEEPTGEELIMEEKEIKEETVEKIVDDSVINALKKDSSGESGMKDREDDKRRA